MNLDERFELLWTDFLEGDLDADGMADLQSLLAQHSHLQERATDLLQTHRLLGFAAQEERTSGEVFAREVLNRLPKTSEAFVGAVMRDVNPSSPSRSRFPWLSWRPLTAAAAGIVFGMFCTSVVFAYVGPSLGKVLTLLQESFESGPAPLVIGVPMQAGKWSGDYTEVVGEQQGVKPESGTKMLRFLRADFEGKVKPEGSYISDVYQLIDLRPYRREFADGGAVVKLSAAFNAFAFPVEEAFGCSVSLQALDAETAMNGSTRVGETLLTDCLAMARNSRLKVDRDPATWQRLNAELRLPPNADFILIRIGLEHSNKAQRRETFDGHYLDGVRLTLARRAPLP